VKDKDINKDFDPKVLKQSAEQMMEQMRKASDLINERMKGMDVNDLKNSISKDDIQKKISQLNAEIFGLQNKIKGM